METLEILGLIEKKFGVQNLSGPRYRPGGDLLLYLVKAGSHLYGTSTEKSDTDYKGIYLPSLKNLALIRVERTLKDSTGDDKSKNNPDDVDVELWSLQYWLELLSGGDTGAMDLLFSVSNKDAVLYNDPYMGLFFNNVPKLVSSADVQNCEWIRYAKSQSVKYGLKGTRMKALEKVLEYIKHCPEDMRLGMYIHDIANAVDDYHNCRVVMKDGCIEFLVLLGKEHQDTTKMGEFAKRVYTKWQEYGARAKKAMESGGVDWKAVSHCMRAIYQTQELLESGKVVYPLKKAKQILNIKQGKLSWLAVEAMIEMGLESIKNAPTNFIGSWDQEFVDHMVLKTYDLEPGLAASGLTG